MLNALQLEYKKYENKGEFSMASDSNLSVLLYILTSITKLRPVFLDSENFLSVHFTTKDFIKANFSYLQLN